tara:strand:+ start:9416 stop:10135 length:720 start_codon:yes stop_codon:yes gene_type:complete
MANLNSVFRTNMTVFDRTTTDFQTCIFDKLTLLDNSTPEELIEHERLITTIGEMENIYELGKSNRSQELIYIEKLILKFIVTSVSEYTTCIDSLDFDDIIDNLCAQGISNNPIDLLRELLRLNSSEPNNYTKQEINTVSNKLLKYVPDVINKIIEISETYEKDKCSNNISNQTIILKKMYGSLINSQKETNFDLTGFGIEEFFNSFNDSIITKSIMLLFLAYILGKIIGLFNVHYNVKQ